MLFSIHCISNHSDTSEIYTLSLHGRSSDLGTPHSVFLEQWQHGGVHTLSNCWACSPNRERRNSWPAWTTRSEEHTSELQSHSDLVCRLLLEKKKKKQM